MTTALRTDEALRVTRAASALDDTGAAIADIHTQLAPDGAQLVILFCSSQYDLDEAGVAIGARFSCPVMCCTTAGELDSSGLRSGGMVGAAITSPQLRARVGLLDKLADEEAARDLCDRLSADLAAAWDGRSPGGVRRFAMMLIDGLSVKEESTASFLYSALGSIPLFGGSAGDDLRFERTAVYWEGKFHTEAATVCLVETSLPFHLFREQHVVPTETRLVVTEADPKTRRVIEFDGDVAADVYAEALGVSRDEVSTDLISRHPMLLRLGGEAWVRSVQRVHDDGSITFFCAIERGVVLTLGRAGDILEKIGDRVAALHEKVGDLRLIVACDCILRRLEFEAHDLAGQVSELLRPLPYIGFNTYGEQFDGLHLNQTLTGLALGVECD